MYWLHLKEIFYEQVAFSWLQYLHKRLQFNREVNGSRKLKICDYGNNQNADFIFWS